MDQDQPEVIETSAKPSWAGKSPGYRFGGAGPGRPPGKRNKQTMEQRAFAEAVCYGMDGQGREAFIAFTAKRLFAGILPPAVEQLIYFYLLGKPVERVEVQTDTSKFDEMTPEQLRIRSLELAAIAAAQVSETGETVQ